jgi:hypothetical protein
MEIDLLAKVLVVILVAKGCRQADMDAFGA